VDTLVVHPLDDLTGTRSRSWIGAAFCEAVKATIPGEVSCSGEGSHQAGGWIGPDGYHLHLFSGSDRIREWTLPAATPIEDAADSIAHELKLPHQAIPEARRAALRAFGEALANTANSRELLREALTRDPGFGPAYVALADQGEDPRALLDQARAGKADPRTIGDLKIRAADRAGDVWLRIEGLRELAGLEPGNATLLGSLGSLLSRVRRPAEAIGPLQKAVALDPASASYRNALAYAYSYANRHEEARRAAEEYRRIAPSDPNAFDTAGEVAFRAGRFGDSAGLYEQAYRADPEFQQGFPLWRAALAKLASGDRTGARAWRDEFFRTAAGRTARSTAEGLWLVLEGDRAGASKAWRASGSAEAMLYAGAFALVEGDRAEARRIAAGLGPGNPVAALLGFTAQDSGPEEVWRNRVEAGVRGPESRLVLALALTLDRKYEAAAKAWKEALGPATALGIADALAAWTAAKAGDKNANIRYIHSAATAGPLDPFYVLLAPDLFRAR
jgi:tetratricopeptide (TPR) repeat protein